MRYISQNVINENEDKSSCYAIKYPEKIVNLNSFDVLPDKVPGQNVGK